MGIGMAKNKQTAFEWYLKSARGSNSDGQNNLGFAMKMYSKGTFKNEKAAFKWYLSSAENGYYSGQDKVSICYRDGFGTSSDQQKAAEWCQKIDKLEFRRKIGKSGFATAYATNWKRTRTDSNILNQLVALKLFNGSKNSCEELIKELIAYSKIGLKNPTFLQCHGISKETFTNEYILVMQYAEMGSLRKNLYEVVQIKWEKKIDLLSYTASDLQIIHSNNIIHCDLHSGNLFQNDLYNAYIGDLGFATSINKTNIKVFMIDKINWPLPCPTSQFPTNFCYSDRQLGYPIIRR
ncbi:kinase-like domain-containing protein [Gigaspora rosea]|uniref:Kinase-like domain-containing protein n=1 Tax=Gigaspora rosea TaxID=44941 RepID=A0A397VC52_9GLOM|nr:kinase-like domain-containing protein [Gigaspora rosea]